MLQMAEKEIILKTKQIDALEGYITDLQKSGKVDMGDIDLVRNLVNAEK
jgi:hypothetical protein